MAADERMARGNEHERFASLVPELDVLDVEKSVAFYTSFGFACCTQGQLSASPTCGAVLPSSCCKTPLGLDAGGVPPRLTDPLAVASICKLPSTMLICCGPAPWKPATPSSHRWRIMSTRAPRRSIASGSSSSPTQTVTCCGSRKTATAVVQKHPGDHPTENAAPRVSNRRSWATTVRRWLGCATTPTAADGYGSSRRVGLLRDPHLRSRDLHRAQRDPRRERSGYAPRPQRRTSSSISSGLPFL
jgi:hypothetical protein